MALVWRVRVSGAGHRAPRGRHCRRQPGGWWQSWVSGRPERSCNTNELLATIDNLVGKRRAPRAWTTDADLALRTLTPAEFARNGGVTNRSSDSASSWALTSAHGTGLCVGSGPRRLSRHQSAHGRHLIARRSAVQKDSLEGSISDEPLEELRGDHRSLDAKPLQLLDISTPVVDRGDLVPDHEHRRSLALLCK